jgi:hypothetical protein
VLPELIIGGQQHLGVVSGGDHYPILGALLPKRIPAAA